MAWPGIKEERIPEARSFLSEFSSTGIGDAIRDYAAWIRHAYRSKLPDAVIAATAKHLNSPLVTRDKGFMKLAELIEVRMV